MVNDTDHCKGIGQRIILFFEIRHLSSTLSCHTYVVYPSVGLLKAVIICTIQL